MNRIFYRGLFILGGLFLAACNRSDGPVVARVGSSAITLADLQNHLQETPQAYQQYLASPEGRRQYLSLLIRERILLLDARRSGLQSNASYKEAVKLFNARMQRRLEDYQDSLLVDTYVRQLRTKDLAVSDAEVRRFYEDHKADFDHPVQIQASHLLVKSPQEAEQALARIKGGEPFEKVASEVSQDPATRVQGGQLKPFRPGTLVPEFEAAAMKLKNGELSGVVKTQFGFHIIRKNGQTALPAQSFEGAKEDIRSRLEREKFDQWVTKKQQALGVKVDEKAMAQLIVPPPAQEPAKP